MTPIVQAGEPVLRELAAAVDPASIPSPAFQQLIETMIAAMREAPGVGLAAPQIGVSMRVIVLEDRPEYIEKLTDVERTERGRQPFAPRVFINPELTVIGEERAMFFEGCLSVEGYAGMVDRAAEVEVRGLDEHGVSQTWRVRGWPARILQHEVDHLNGVLYVDRMNTRTFMAGEQAKARYAGKSIAEIRRALGL